MTLHAFSKTHLRMGNIRVFLDGVNVANRCVAACEDEGWVECFFISPLDGRILVDYDRNPTFRTGAPTYTRFGQVEILPYAMEPVFPHQSQPRPQPAL